MDSAPPHPFALLLRRHRIAAGLTQEALAERAGLSARAISDLERGVNRAPQPATLQLLAEGLGLSAEERAQFQASARRRHAPAPDASDRPAAPQDVLVAGDAVDSSVAPANGATPADSTSAMGLAAHEPLAPLAEGAQPLVPHSPTPTRAMPSLRGARRLLSKRALSLMGLAVLVSGMLALRGASDLSRAGAPGALGTATTGSPVRGGTWTHELRADPTSLLPNGGGGGWASNILVDQALYLPLFYGDANGQIHPGAARELPTQRNGGVNADATT
jgi:transcriptional regulator with XRE-family HTH domain